jgi:hypothetical protein
MSRIPGPRASKSSPPAEAAGSLSGQSPSIDGGWQSQPDDVPIGTWTDQQVGSVIRQACARGKGVLVFPAQGHLWARELNADGA